MPSAAVIVGIDSYATQPLTSAVNDALAFRDALVSQGFVGPNQIQLLTAPRSAGALEPTQQNILDALYPFFDRPNAVDRLFFYFAGHGMLTFEDAAHARSRTALVPGDLEDLKRQGKLLIDLDSALERLRTSGPAEQFFFIDACRDLPYEQHPDVDKATGWAGGEPGPERAQAVLYAVPPLGRARGEKEGMGVMTRHLIDALDGRGIALDYSDDLEAFVVTAESIKAYVHKRVLDAVGELPLWQQKYSLPRLHHPEPKTEPLHVIPQPSQVELTVHIDPPDAAANTRVALSKARIEKCSWPPNAYEQPYALDPLRYWLNAESKAGAAAPNRAQIDVREEREATIRVSPEGEAPGPPAPPPEPGPSAPVISRGPLAKAERAIAGARTGVVDVMTLEPQAMVELERLDPPYSTWSLPHHLHVSVPPGSYRVRCRLGDDVFSETEVAVEEGEEVTVTPRVGESQVVREILGTPQHSEVISESIGPIQAVLLPTMLPIVGIKPFDTTGELFGIFDNLVPQSNIGGFGGRALSVVVAVDGMHWNASPQEVLSSVRCTAVGANTTVEVPLSPRPSPLERVALGLAPAPGSSFKLQFHSPHFGRITVFSAALDRRVTVVTLTLRPSGAFDVAQNLLRVPGIEYPEEPVTYVPYDRMLRDIQLGQRLYASGELAPDDPVRTVMDLFYAKWTDPILSCMAYFAVRDAPAPAAFLPPDFVDGAAKNLRRFFGDLPDSRVVYGLAFEQDRDALFAELIRREELPVLARSGLELARWAAAKGQTEAEVAAVTPRVLLDQPWLLTWEVATTVAAVAQATTAETASWT